MELLGEIINYIGKTNLFNFIIFALIIAYLCKYLNVGDKLDSEKQSILVQIENSKSTKEESKNELTKIENSVANIEDEVSKIIKQAELNAQSVGGKVMEDASLAVDKIKSNSQKIMETRSNLLKNDIMKRASSASIEVAKKHIIEELNKNTNLHQKLIDESIEAINGVKF